MKFHIWSVIWRCKFVCSIRYQDIREILIIELENQQDLNGSLALKEFIYIVSIKIICIAMGEIERVFFILICWDIIIFLEVQH